MSIELKLDRSLPIPIGVQLRGLIEYGVACGELSPGERLPSVRDLACSLGVAPMTVTAVYRDLASAQLIETRPGAGTYVLPRAPQAAPAGALHRLDALLDRLIGEANASGLGREALIARLSARAQLPRRPLRLVFIGVFAEASRDYAEAIGRHLPQGDTIKAMTVGALASSETLRAQAAGADLILTLANRRAEIAGLLDGGPPLIALSFLPSEATRTALARLDPRARLAVVSIFPEFLAIMKAGVQRHAAHVSAIEAALLDEDLPARLASADVLVHATGAEAARRHVPPGMTVIEYRHTPDPRDIERDVLPRLAALRASVKEKLEEAS